MMNPNSVRRKLGRYRSPLILFVVLVVVFLIFQGLGILDNIAFNFSSSTSGLAVIGVLLAVTFTSYSLLFLVIPYLRESLKKTKTMGGIGNVFLLTIYTEMASIALDFSVQFSNSSSTDLLAVRASVISFFLSSYSILLIAVLSFYIHLLFEQARTSQKYS